MPINPWQINFCQKKNCNGNAAHANHIQLKANWELCWVTESFHGSVANSLPVIWLPSTHFFLLLFQILCGASPPGPQLYLAPNTSHSGPHHSQQRYRAPPRPTISRPTQKTTRTNLPLGPRLHHQLHLPAPGAAVASLTPETHDGRSAFTTQRRTCSGARWCPPAACTGRCSGSSRWTCSRSPGWSASPHGGALRPDPRHRNVTLGTLVCCESAVSIRFSFCVCFGA